MALSPCPRGRAFWPALVLAATFVGLLGPLPAIAADPAPAAGPSFDCAHAQGVVEAAICTDPTLAAEDRTMAQMFALVRTDALGAGPSGELAAQRKWLADRDKQCAA